METSKPMTVTLPEDVIAVVEDAVRCGNYTSASEVVRDALREWQNKRALHIQELASLKVDIERGLADISEGRVRDFDSPGIIERGRSLLATRSPSS